jgi:dienelactone hydrolase
MKPVALQTLALALLIFSSSATLAEPADVFTVSSSDGTPVHGQADRPETPSGGVVVMAAGTGGFDRDVRFGTSRGPRDLIFADLAARLMARGVTVVRYDKRGVSHGGDIDPALIATATTDAQRDDLGAVYDWARSVEGLGARCVALFGHSEGMAHVGRLASSGAPAPALVYGMAALVDQPARNFRWNFVDRIPASLTMLDTDGDGFTSDAEIDAGWETTPAAVELVRAHFGHPAGGWSTEAIDGFRQIKAAQFDAITAQVLATPDDAPWPSADAPQGVYQWWKSWWLDDTPVAERLAVWSDTPVRLIYGDRDSQTRPDRQEQAARSALRADRLTFDVVPGVGHTLGPHVAYGPMDEALADRVADEIAAGLTPCLNGA